MASYFKYDKIQILHVLSSTYIFALKSCLPFIHYVLTLHLPTSSPSNPLCLPFIHYVLTPLVILLLEYLNFARTIPSLFLASSSHTFFNKGTSILYSDLCSNVPSKRCLPSPTTYFIVEFLLQSFSDF